VAEQSPEAALPLALRHHFHEYSPERLRVVADSVTVMLRLMEAGDLDAIRWLRQTYGDAALSEFIARRRGRGLSPKRLRFRELLLELPHDEVTPWVASARAGSWHNRCRM
jgi:hypothetical protein